MSNAVLWNIRDLNGKTHGPFTTADILNKIRNGDLQGEEKISKHPDGSWVPLSQESDFYDSLLEALKAPARMDDSDNEGTHKSITNQDTYREKTEIDAVTHTATAVPIKPKTQKVKPKKKPQTVTLQKNSQLWFRIPLAAKVVVIFFAVVAVVYAVDSFSARYLKTESEKIHLMSISYQPVENPVQKSNLFREAVDQFAKDNFETYLDAEIKLVNYLNADPQSLEARALLCATYRELWPYAFQDDKDQKTLKQLVRSTRQLNIGSPYGNFCETVDLFLSDKFPEAKSSLDHMLENVSNFSLLPVAFSLKAEIYELNKELKYAIPYYDKAIQLWPQWLQPKVHKAKILKDTNPQSARELLISALQSNPRHKEARVLLGILVFQKFHQTDDALGLLTAALKQKEKVRAPLASEGHQVLAEIYVERGEKKSALQEALQALKLWKKNEAARKLVVRLGGEVGNDQDSRSQNEVLYLGDQYARQGDCLSAQAEYKAAFELDPKNDQAAIKAAGCLWKLNQRFEAMDWVKKAQRASVHSTAAYLLQADFLSQRYDFDAAQQALLTALKKNPQSFEVLRGFALIELRKNNYISAIRYGQRALKIYDADLDTVVILAKANLNLALSLQGTEKSQAEKRDQAVKEAAKYATKANELDAASSDAQIIYARMLAATTGVDTAIQYMEKQIQKFSFSDELKIAMAELYQGEDRFNQSQIFYQQVIDRNPRNAKAWLGVGICQKALGLNDAALKSFLQAAAIDPTEADALFQVGRLYLETGRAPEAMKVFKKAAEVNPRYPQAQLFVAKAALQMKQLDEALRATEEEKKFNPDLAEVYLIAAEIYSAQGYYSECAGQYTQAIKLRPQSAAIYVKAGQCYRQAGSLDLAETMLTLAEGKESGYADLYRELGALLDKKGDLPAAVKAYKNYLELAPNALDRGTVEERLKNLGGG